MPFEPNTLQGFGVFICLRRDQSGIRGRDFSLYKETLAEHYGTLKSERSWNNGELSPLVKPVVKASQVNTPTSGRARAARLLWASCLRRAEQRLSLIHDSYTKYTR